MQIKQPGCKMGFQGGHAPAVTCPGLRRVMYLDLSGRLGSQ